MLAPKEGGNKFLKLGGMHLYIDHKWEATFVKCCLDPFHLKFHFEKMVLDEQTVANYVKYWEESNYEAFTIELDNYQTKTGHHAVNMSNWLIALKHEWI